MNKSYRIVWSDARKAFIVASECAKGKGKRSSSSSGAGAASVLAASLLMTSSFAIAGPPVSALPTNGTVTAGAASIAVKGSSMTIDQATQSAIINWSTFDIGSGASVQFVQPNSSSTALNRVLSAAPSEIYGSLKSNGNVFLVNPQGIVVGQGAQLNIGGFIASSLSISDSDFLAGQYNFQGNGASGHVSNAGNIQVASGGIAALIGSQVSNSGIISAKLGSVALASGNKVTVGVDDTGLLSVGVTQSTLNALASNSGAIYADGGRIILTAKSANAVLDTVVNNDGILQSQSIGMRNGQVWMLASDPLANTGATGAAVNAGAVQNAAGGVATSGTIDVSSSVGTSAGQVTLAGTTVDVSGAILAGSSSSGGGRVLINSTQSSVVDSGSMINVSSTAAAGAALVWSAGDTTFNGTINGQGSGAVGHGASVEISAEKSDTINGAVNDGAQLAANAGTLLIDPATLEIGVTAGSGIVTQASLESTSGAIVLNATGQVTVDALTNNNLNLANATSFSLTSNNTGGIQFLNGASGPSGITTYNGAPITLTASGNGSLLNVGKLTTHGGNIALSGIAVQLGAGLDASTAGNQAANGGTVGVSVFGGAISGSGSSGIIAGSSVTLDATYGYIGSATSSLATATNTLNLLTGGNAYVTDTASLTNFSLVSNHLMGSPVGIAVSAPNLLLTGNDTTGDGTLYDASVKWVQYSASTNGAGSGPTSVSITQDTNLLPWAINLPGSNVTLTSSNADILGGNAGGNAIALTANNLVLRSPYAIGGINASGNIDSAVNGSASDGLALATSAATIDAKVLNSTGAIADNGIISLNQTGNLVGNVNATYINLNASGAIGTSGTPFVMTFDGSPGNNLTMYSNTNPESAVTGSAYVSTVTAGGSVFVNASYNGDNAPIALTNVTAGGSLGFNLTDSCDECSPAYFNNVSATGAVNLAGFAIYNLYVGNVSSNTSINISTDANSYGTLEVDNATLNGADNANRFITIAADSGSVVAANLSTDGNVASTAGTPLGTININAAGSASSLFDGYTGVTGTIRAAAVNINANSGINFNANTDTAALLNLNVPDSGNLTFNARAVDAVTDPTGTGVHPLQIGGVTNGAYYGTVSIANSNGGLQVGQVRASGGYGTINLSATNGAILAATGGGLIDAYQWGHVNLSSTGTNGGLGLTGGLALSTNASYINLTTSGDMNISNSLYSLYRLNMTLEYAANTGANHYSFLSGPSTTPDVSNSVNFSASTPGTTAAGSNPNVLTVAATTFNGNGLGTVTMYADGDVTVAPNGITNSAQTYLYANNVTIGDSSPTPGLITTGGGFYVYANNNVNVGTIQADNSYIYLYGSYNGAPGNISVNSISSAQNPGQPSQNTYVQLNTSAGSISANSILTSGNGIDMYARGGDLSLGTITTDSNNTINLFAYTGNLLGINSSNLLSAGNLNLNNQAGNIGTAATPVNVAVSSNLAISNQPGSIGAGGGGSIYLGTHNDPTNLTLELSSNQASSTYATSTYSITPNATFNPNGLTLQGTSDVNGITISNIGVTGSAPATQVSTIGIVADAPMVSIDSGINATAPVAYGLSLGYSNNYGIDTANASPVVNLAGSAGKLVTLNIDNSTTANNISGTLSLDDFLINANSGNLSNPAVSVNFSLLAPLQNFTLNRNGSLASLDSYVLTDGASTGQSFNATNTGTLFNMSAANTNSSNHLNLIATINGESIQADTLALTANDTINLTANQILGTATNQITAGTVALNAVGGYGSTVGMAGGQAVNIAAGNVELTSQGNINVNLNGGTLTDLSVDVSHPGGYNSSNAYVNPYYLSTYTISGGVSLSAVDSGLDTTLSLSGASALNFAFTTDRNLLIAGIGDTGGSVTLTSNGNYSGGYSNGSYTPDDTPIGIEQSGSTGITANQVTLNATGFLGHVGTGGTALIVATPDLSVTTNGGINLADSAVLTTLALNLSHGQNQNNAYADNSYTISDGGDLALTITDSINTTCLSCYNGSTMLSNLTSSNLTNFSLTLTDSGVSLGLGNFSGSDFSGGQINLSHTGSVVNLSSAGSIFFSPQNATPNSLSDSPASPLDSTKAVVVADTLNLTANGNIGASPWFYWGQQGDSLPVQVNNLGVSATGAVQIANIGNVNITNAQAGGSFFGWAVASNGSASITMPGSGVIASPNVELMANYGDIGTTLNPLITNTGTLTLIGGGDMFVANQSLLSSLSITSSHNKTITDPTSDGLNTMSISDNTLAGGTPLQLGITDTSLNNPTLSTSYGQSGYNPALNVYQYQMDGLNEPNLTFAFTSDSGMSVGSLSAAQISLTSQTGSILAYQGGVNGVTGTTTAPGGVTLTVQSQGQSIGAVGSPVLIDSPAVTFNTGGNLVVKDSSIIDALTFNTQNVQAVNSVAPVYTIDNSAAPSGHQLTFDVTADPTYDSNAGIVNINNIALASGNAGDALSVNSYSNIGINAISVPGSGGSVSLGSNSQSLVGLPSATGIVADNVSMSVGPWGAGQNIGTSVAPIMVDTANLSVSSNTSGGGNTYVSFVAAPTRTLTSVSVSENSIASSNSIAIVDNSVFNLLGGDNGNGSFSLLSATGLSTDLSFATYSDFHIGTLNLGSGNLSLQSYYNSINADGGSSATPNIVTTGNVTLGAGFDVGHDSSTAIYTNVAGNVSISANNTGNIFLNQVGTTTLNITSLSTYPWVSNSIDITSGGAMNLSGINSMGNGTLTLTAGGDLNYFGNIYTNQSAVSLTSTAGSINANNYGIYGASGVTLTAAQNISVGPIGTNYLNGGYGNGPTSNAITLTATAGNVDLTNGNSGGIPGALVSNTSVNITAGGYIHSEGDNFGLTPVVNLLAAGDIGYWNGTSLSAWNLNDSNTYYYAGSYSLNPGTLTLDAVSTGGAINLASYAGVNVTRLAGASNVALQVYGDYLVPTAGILIGADTSGTGAGTVASTAGSVTLTTNSGDITGAAGNLTKAQDSITLLAQESLYQNNNGGNSAAVLNATVFNLGDSTNALALNAADINLTANGNIYATLPATGVTDISVARSYVDVQNNNNWSSIGTLMPAGTVQIDQAGSPGTHIVEIADGGVNGGVGSSTLAVNYGSALNFTYNSVDAIQLGTVNLGSGNLTLGISNPFDVGITSAGSSISGGQVTFNLNAETNYASPSTVASGGFGTAGNAINTEVSSISGTTTGATAGFYVNQTGAIILNNLQTGGGIGVISTGDITLEGHVGSQNAAVSLDAGSAAINSTGTTPLISASGDLTLTGASIDLANSSMQSSNGNVSLTANSGAMVLTNSTMQSTNGNVSLTASSGMMALTDSTVTAGGSITLTQGSGSLDLSTAHVNAATTVDITAAQDITIGAIDAGTTATLTATNGIIQGTTNSVGITGSTVALNAATGIGTVHSVLVTGGNGDTITANTTTGDVNLLTGLQSDQYSSAILNVSTGGGAIDVVNHYGTLELASVVSNANGATDLGNIFVTNQANNTSIQIDSVTAAGGGAMVAIDAPSGSIFDNYLGTGITASRIAVNALGQGGSIYSGGSPVATVNGVTVSGVQVNGQAVVAVASGDISLNSTNTNLSQMPLVASNGSGSTINIVSAGDFQVGQIVAGLNAGTVNINSAASILDDGNASTQIQAGIVNLAAANNIGSGVDSIGIAAHDYTNNTGGVISAASVGTGNIYLNQTGDVTLQSLTTANGAITVQVAGNTFVNLADSHATDASGNNVNITLSSGDMTVNQAIAGATMGVVNLTATAGSILGDAYNSSYGSSYSPNGSPTLRDCCTDPHISGSAANLVALNNIGSNGNSSGSDATQTLSVDTSSLSTSTTTNGASTILFVANPADQTVNSAVALGSDAFSFTALGSNSIINIQACNNLDLTGMGDGTAWLHTGAGTNVTLAAQNNLLLPNMLNTSSNTSLGLLTLIGGNDVIAPNNGSTPHTLNIDAADLVLKTGAAGSTGAAGTADSLVVNATGNIADVIVTGSTPTDLTINTDNHTIISAANNNGNIAIGMPDSGNLNIYAVTDTMANGMVTLTASAGGIAQAAQDNLGQFSQAGVSANGITFNTLHDIGSIATPMILAVNDVGANVASNGGVYLAITPQSGTATITGMTTSNGDIDVTSSGLLTVGAAIQAGTSGSGNVNLTATGDINLDNAVSAATSVNLTSSANILDNGNPGAQIQAPVVNLTATDSIGSSVDAIAITAHDNTNNTAGVISASSVGTGNIYLSQTGDVTLQSLTTANGAITVQVAGNTFVNLADSHATDANGNNVNITLSSGDMTVNQVIAGATLGVVNLTATAGSILGDAYNSSYGSSYSPNGSPTPRDCCTDPHVSGSAANLVALNNIGSNGNSSGSDATQTLSVDTSSLSTSTTTNGASTVLYVANPADQTANSAVALGSDAFSFTALGSNSIINIQACNNLDLTGMGDGTAWLHTGAGTNVTLAAQNNLLLPNMLNTSSNTSLGLLTLIGGNDVMAPNNGSTPHTLNIDAADLVLKTGAAGSTGAAGTADSLVVNATGNIADVIVTGSTPTDLAINTDNHTIISAANNNGNIAIGMPDSGSLNIYAVTDTMANGMVTLTASAGGIAQAAQDNLGQFSQAGVSANGITFNTLHDIGSVATPMILAVNDVGANVASNGGVYLAITPQSGTATITGMTTSNGDIDVTSSGLLTVGGAIQAGTSGSGNVNLAATGNINLDNAVSAATSVNLIGSANILDNGNPGARIQAPVVNLTATENIGSSVDPVAIAAHDNTNNSAGVISASSVGTGNIYLSQTGDVILQSLTTANGAITAMVAGNTFVNLADSHATDASGNDVNITLSSGDMTVNQAIAGATLGVVNLTASAGSILGDAYNSSYGSSYSPNGSPTLRDCCTDPHVSGSAANLVAQNNIGYNSSDATQTLSIDTSSLSTSTTANGASTVLSVANQAVGGGAYSFAALGTNSNVDIQACNNLDLSGIGAGTAWVHTGAGSNVTLAAVNDLLLPDTLNTSNSAFPGVLTLIGGNDVMAPDNGSTPHTLNINTGDLVLKTGAAGSTGAAGTADSLIVNATGNVADVIVTGTTPTDLAINTDNHTVISAANNNGNIAIGMPDSGNLNIYAVTDTMPNAIVTLNAGAGSIAQATQDNLGQFSAPGVSANSIMFNTLNAIGSATTPLTLTVNNVGANVSGDGGIYLAIAPQSGTATLSGMTTSNGDIAITSTGLLTVSGAIQAGTSGSSVSLAAAGNINLNNTVNATSVDITGGANIIDGYGSSTTPTVTASSVNIASAGTIAGTGTAPLWMNAQTISATSTGVMQMSDTSTSPVTLAMLNSQGGDMTIASVGTINLNKISAGAGDVTITSTTGAIGDGISGHASLANPNITSTGTVTLNAATHVGTADDSIWVAGAVAATGGTTPNPGGTQVWINTLPPMTAYPQMPAIAGVSNQTVFSTIAFQEMGAPLNLPFIVAGTVQRTSEPMKVDVSGFGVTLPDDLGPVVNVQDQTFNTKPATVEGGNATEYGRQSQSAISQSCSKDNASNNPACL